MTEISPCIGNDPACPCQDGDACHYRDLPGSPAWPIPVASTPKIDEHPHVEKVREYLDNAGVTPETLRYAATHESLCRHWIFDLLTNLATVLEESSP